MVLSGLFQFKRIALDLSETKVKGLKIRVTSCDRSSLGRMLSYLGWSKKEEQKEEEPKEEGQSLVTPLSLSIGGGAGHKRPTSGATCATLTP